MTSSQIAITVLCAKWLVASLVVTSAMLRIASRPRQRPWHYALAWVICASVVGALLSATDVATGRVAFERKLADFSLAGATAGLALVGGWAWTRRAAWAHTGRLARFLTLLAIHAIIILLAALPMI